MFRNRFSIALRFPLGVSKLRQYLFCRRHMAHSSDNKTNENLNHRDVESDRVCETVSCASSHSLASTFRPLFSLTRFPSGSITPESRDYAPLPRGTFSGTTPAAAGGFGDDGGARTNLAAVGPFPPSVRSKRARDFRPASVR